MDRKLAKENIKLSKHLFNDLEHGRYNHALKISGQIDSNTHYINKEIRTGKARKERS